MSDIDEIFGAPIYTYTRTQAIEDGVLVSANVGDLAEVSAQYPGIDIAMTHALFTLIERAVASPRHCNDWRGVWHDILRMSRSTVQRGGGLFLVIITGCGRVRNQVLKVECHANDAGAPALTFMLRDED